MINGVLVERTVKEVVPALKTNSEGLKKVLDELVVQYKSKQDEMEKWKVRSISLWIQAKHLFRTEHSADVTTTSEKEQHPSRPAVRLPQTLPNTTTKTQTMYRHLCIYADIASTCHNFESLAIGPIQQQVL